MDVKKILPAAALIFLMCLPVYAESPSRIVGAYTELPGKESTFDGNTVEIIEFLSFYCGHCFRFEESIPVIKGNFPHKIEWKTVPIHWGKGSTKPAEAYFLAKEAGKGRKMKEALFRAQFIERKDISDIKVLEELGMKTELGFDFSRRLRAGDKEEEAENALQMTKEYSIRETPTLIIAGNLKVSPRMVNGDMNLFRENVLLILRSLFGK